MSFIHTTFEDFSQPGYVAQAVEISTDNDGSIRLATSGQSNGNWCEPVINASSNLPGSASANAVTAIPNEAFIGTGANASGPSLTHMEISNTSPPVATENGTFDGHKTNDIFGETGFAYLATDTNSKEVIIIDTNTMGEVGDFDISGSTDGTSIFVSGNVGYVISSNRLTLFNLNAKNGTRPAYGSVTLSATGTSVYVVGNYAYVTTTSTSSQLQIINVTNVNSPSVVSSFGVNGQAGKDIYVSPDGNRSYLVTGQSATQREFFLLDTGNKSSPIIISSYDTNGMDPRAVEMVLSGSRALIGGNSGEEYQVVNISNESNPVRCGGMNLDTGVYDVASVIEPDGDVYAYLASGDAADELKIIAGGPGNTGDPGGGTYGALGEYISPIFDAGFDTMYNRFTFLGNIPPEAAITYQVAIADAVNGNCQEANYIYVGPDGTSGTTYNTEAGMPFDNDGSGFENPARCFRYKIIFTTTDPFITPYVYETIVNYSP